MKRILLLVALISLAGCEPDESLDQQRSTQVAKNDCRQLGGELQQLRWLPLGEVHLEATCLTKEGTTFKINPSPVYRY